MDRRDNDHGAEPARRPLAGREPSAGLEDKRNEIMRKTQRKILPVDSNSAREGRMTYLTGSILRLDPAAPLWPANIAALLMTLELESKPAATREEIAAGLLPDSCSVIVRAVDVINYRRKFARAIGVPQRASLRSRNVKIIN
jgi:hypothetical protein